MHNKLADAIKGLFGVRNTVAEIGAQIKAAQARIQYLKNSPPPPSDVVAYFEKLVDAKAAQYNQAFAFTLDRLARDPLRMEANDGIGVFTAVGVGLPASFQSVEVAILAVFGEDVKAAIRKRIGAARWPGEPGPPVAERPALIAKAEAELKELEGQLNKLRSEAAAAGITL